MKSDEAGLMSMFRHVRICIACVATSTAMFGLGCASTPTSDGMSASRGFVDAEASERLLAEAREQFETGNVNQAVQTLELAVEANPFDGRLHYNLGVLALRRGAYAAAAMRFERAAELMPQAIEPQLGIASTLLQTGRCESAAEAFKRALALDPANAAALEWLAIALDHAKQTKGQQTSR